MFLRSSLIALLLSLSISFAAAQNDNNSNKISSPPLTLQLKTVSDTIHELINKQKNYLGIRLKMLQSKQLKNR